MFFFFSIPAAQMWSFYFRIKVRMQSQNCVLVTALHKKAFFFFFFIVLFPMKETRKSSKLARVETSQNGFSRGTAHLWDRFPATSFDNGTFSMEIDERQNHCRVEETWWLSFDSMLEFAFQTIHEESNFPEFDEDLFPYCLEIRFLFKMLLSNIGIIECYAFTLILYSNKVSSILHKKVVHF